MARRQKATLHVKGGRGGGMAKRYIHDIGGGEHLNAQKYAYKSINNSPLCIVFMSWLM